MNESTLAFGIVLVAFLVVVLAIVLGFGSVLHALPSLELPR